jgi:ethanolamine ammonia-lyase small subunit
MGLRVEWFDRKWTWVTAESAGTGIGADKVEDGKVAVLFSNGEQAAAVQGTRLEILEMLREGLRQVADLPADTEVKG